MRALGIDPGLNGGAAILEVGEGGRARLIAAIDLPTYGENAKRRIDMAQLQRWILLYKPDVGFIERAQAMPDQGASSGFIYGRAVGALEACIVCSGVELHLVEASVWKRAASIPGGASGKEASRFLAKRLWPGSALFDLKKHHQRAEAALLAKHGLERLPQSQAA